MCVCNEDPDETAHCRKNIAPNINYVNLYHRNIIPSSEGSCAHSGRNIHCYKITDKNGQLMIVEKNGKIGAIFFFYKLSKDPTALNTTQAD